MNSADILAGKQVRALAIPFSGPFPAAGTPGLDSDSEYFDRTTQIKASLYPSLPVLFHHGDDAALGHTELGRAVLDKAPTDEGWWATVSFHDREPAVGLLRALAHRVPLYCSSQPLSRGTRRDRSGRITVWPVCELTITPAPSNTHARIEAMP